MKHILITTLLIIAGITASAQNEPRECPPSGMPDGGQRPPRFEQIESMKVAFFTTELNLSPEEATRFWPVYNKFSNEFRERGHQTKDIFCRMEKAAKEGKCDDVEYRKLVDSYIDSKIKESEIIKLHTPEFYKVLSPEKVAKLFVAEEHFRFKMIEMWRGGQHDKPQKEGR